MPSSRCVVEGCNNQASRKKGLSVHLSPSAGKRRKVWLKFVNTHRENFPPSDRFVICSAHFTEDSFKRLYVRPQIGCVRRLKEDANPTMWRPKSTCSPQSKRSRRKVSTVAQSYV